MRKVKFIGDYSGKVAEFVRECERKNRIFELYKMWDGRNIIEVKSDIYGRDRWTSWYSSEWCMIDDFEIKLDDSLFEL